MQADELRSHDVDPGTACFAINWKLMGGSLVPVTKLLKLGWRPWSLRYASIHSVMGSRSSTALPAAGWEETTNESQEGVKLVFEEIIRSCST